MDQVKIGKFIAECRKNQNLTQSELAEYLGVSDRSISKWETGRCMPDISLMQPLCEKLDITINELFCGERLEPDMAQKRLEETIIINITSLKEKTKKILKGILFILISIPIFLLLGFILFELVQNYRHEKIELPKETGRASICQYSDHLLHLSIQADIPAFVTIQSSDGKQVYKLYRLRDSKLMQDTAWGGNYVIQLEPRGIEIALMEVPDEIYYYTELLWKKGMKIPMCEDK